MTGPATTRPHRSPAPGPGQYRPAVWLADAVRAFAALEPDAATTTAVLELLGLRPAPRPLLPELVVSVTGAVPVLPEPTVVAPPTSRAVAATRESTGRAPPSSQGPASRPVIEADDRAAAVAPRPVPLLRDVLPPLPPALHDEPASLLPPGQQRAILARLSSRAAPLGDIDVDVLVQLLAERAAVQSLPRHPAVTTSRGLQLLLDFGDGMQGFQRDRREVLEAVRAVAGADGLEVLRFGGTPLDDPGAGPGPRWTWEPYSAPAWGRPVLIISDLGTAARATPRDAIVNRWIETARMLRIAGCPVTALVPTSPARVATELQAAVGVVPWDRTTGVRDAVAAAKRAARRLPKEESG